MCGYTYGPLLGLFAYAGLSPNPSPVGRGKSLTPNPSPVGREKSLSPNPSPIGRGTTITSSKRGGTVAVCILSPLLCFAIDQLSQHFWGYHFGYELLMLNGLLTFCGLWAVDRVRKG
jgi:hypothetical protein